MMKPEPSELIAARRVVLIVAALAAVVLEEFVEELLHRRARRQIGQFLGARVDLLRRRNIDHRIDHLFGDVGDVVRTARAPPVAAGSNATAAATRGDRRAVLNQSGKAASRK